VHGFPEAENMMTVLLDDDDHKHPTFFNLTEAFKSLSEQSQPGDAVFIHFAGHGGRILDSGGDVDTESYDEVIVPSDYTTNGLVRDTLIFKTLLAPMRYGVTVTLLIDTCDTGMVFDMPYSWTPRSNSSPKMTPNEDFSFVRFLKVVKTLYESCTFTQLGKTVGSALNNGNNIALDATDEDEDSLTEEADGAHPSNTDADKVTALQAHEDVAKSGLLGFLCGTPMAGDRASPSKSDKRLAKPDELAFEAKNLSLFEQVMTCTLGHDVGAFELDDASLESSYLKANETVSFSERGETTEDESFDDDDDSHFRHSSRQRRPSSRGRRGRK